MAVGSKIIGAPTSVAASATLDIRPPAGQEWTIMNIKYSGTNGTISFSDYDGTTLNAFDTDSCPGSRLGLCENLTNSYWIRITNTGSSAVVISYNGVQTT